MLTSTPNSSGLKGKILTPSSLSSSSYYSYPYSNQKFPILIEYYKFHNPIPRFFMLPLSLLINQIHDKKRKIEYWKIVKKIQQENL